MIIFSNTYSNLPERFFERTLPAKIKDSKLIAFNYQVASDLGLNLKNINEEELALIFSGQNILPSSNPIAMVYAAHQFGHFVPQLGDGRAHLIGESNGFDIQLKGSGQTRFSRNGDGKSTLGSVIREYLVSEAMFHLGVPTTRALAAVTTGETLHRDTLQPGGILTRIAPNHIRVGTFQYFSYHQDREGLEILLDYSIKRNYPHLAKIKNLSDRTLSFIKAVGEKQAKLIAKWLSFGFIHGVMNTDNYSIGGFTIDFGPCAFMDEYKKDKTFSSIDRNARYSYSNQIPIAQWNLLRLGDSLLPLIDKEKNKSIAKIEMMIGPIMDNFDKKYWKYMALKFGITDYQESDKKLINSFLSYLEEEELDFTLAFRNLTNLYHDNTDFYSHINKIKDFISIWKNKVSDIEKLNLINPLFIPRNHQIEKAIKQVNNGKYEIFNDLMTILKKPFSENEEFNQYTLSPKVEERVTQTFCGT